MKPEINLFEYNNYRSFLRDYYQHRKSDSKHAFSFRVFSRKAGLKSPNYFKMVMEGDRNLSSDMILRFAEALGLNNKQCLFFESLVQFNQADESDNKDFYFRKMLSFKEYRSAAKLVAEQYDYLSRWYYVAIRELLVIKNIKHDPESIAARLANGISAKQVAEALRVLELLGMIRKTTNNRYEQVESRIVTDATIAAISAFQYHRQMIRFGAEALSLPVEQREISAMTMAVPEEHIATLKQKVFQFLIDTQNWLETVGGDPAEVYQLNFQLFPLSEKKSKGGLHADKN